MFWKETSLRIVLERNQSDNILGTKLVWYHSWTVVTSLRLLLGSRQSHVMPEKKPVWNYIGKKLSLQWKLSLSDLLTSEQSPEQLLMIKFCILHQYNMSILISIHLYPRPQVLPHLQYKHHHMLGLFQMPSSGNSLETALCHLLPVL